jgi:hypothetical protein
LLLPLIFRRRIGVATALPLIVGVLLAAMVVPFTGFHGILVLLLESGAGMLWEIDASRAKGRSD